MDVYKLVQINPFPKGLCEELTRYDHILFAEECVEQGGIGDSLGAALSEYRWPGHLTLRGVRSGRAIPHASVAELREFLGLDAASLANAIERD